MNIKNVIWYEKYRPKTITQMVLGPELINKFCGFIKKRDFPHLLLSGPPGTGKTTISYILMNEIPSYSLELNASSRDRGINVIKEEVSRFASSMPRKGRIKIVFMDEADGLTPDAQRALKNTIEKYSKHCKFILTANNPHKIIPEIKSRLQHIIFGRGVFTERSCVKFLQYILEKEAVEYKDKDVEKLVSWFFPDIRKIINNAQLNTIDGKLIIKKVESIKLEKILVSNDFNKLSDFITDMFEFSGLYRYLFDEFIYKVKLDEKKRKIVLIIAKYVYQDSLVLDKAINFFGCCLEIMEVLHGNRRS